MKRLLVLFVALGIVLSVSAEITKLKAYQAAFKYEDSDWTEWEKCDVKITFNDDIIKVYCNVPQTYMILYQLDNSDNILGYKAVDDDNIHCSIKFRFIDGIIQMYIIYNDCSIVYNVKVLES